MAKVIGPLHSDSARGAYGDVLKFSEWRGRAYVQRFRKPRNPRSPRQSEVRAAVAALAQYWRTLDVAEREAWTAYAAANPVTDPWTGQATVLPGYNWFLKVNLLVTAFGEDIQDAVPTGTTPSPLIDAELAKATTTVVLNFTNTPLEAGIAPQVWLFETSSAGRTPSDKDFKFLKFGTVAQATAMVVATGVAGITYHAAVRTLNTLTGLTSAYVRATPYTFVPTPP